MLYTIIDIYEVLRTDEIYPQFGSGLENNKSVDEDNNSICTDPYKYLHKI